MPARPLQPLLARYENFRAGPVDVEVAEVALGLVVLVESAEGGMVAAEPVAAGQGRDRPAAQVLLQLLRLTWVDGDPDDFEQVVRLVARAGAVDAAQREPVPLAFLPRLELG
ncbi:MULTISPECIES: hypothetical protein [unclassified Solwaraspora]|uniref:hypothetical protein n=1 Tax=unclassified Solwaraspora TaxID=2627926 RepID=UPI00248BDCB1|nr:MULTISPECIES: hypothetical protein [unclassified Solwaraspora]WBB97307.1 hypothetical protein O7553_29400 [Solwaraspora sp. WMMA2059]WBB97421.1 hypothetical protein O7553_30090 [Solwaraspora sp. WMMA2059]WBC18791.1 hypothetical protein O7543_17960 [Solwaraspora sp. WMMA2080]WJK33803.1 hypothetical protein O7610_24565 [Solwaraspora sp. WMMA2065]